MAQGRKMFEELVRVEDGRGKEFGRLICGVAEHHALVACALFCGGAAIDAAGNVRGLAMQVGMVREGIEAEVFFRAVVADLLDDLACDAFGVDFVEAAARDFAEVEDDVGADHGFAGDVRGAVGLEARIEDGVRDLVCDLIRMAFGDGLR